ncbi:unnamed protein product [Candida verbasci]|uniref:Dolichyl-diphosphooligosaccharide-protein glycosyltransferase subunit OST5 n=1 Tax=Candida verbasci TaxID=1227364 RepID=A0A9W4XBP3_9ASCO|nr:unnamed protein product [Candida verbasci]
MSTYDDYAKLFNLDSTPVEQSSITSSTTYFTIFLILISFSFLSMTLLGDIKNKSFITYLINSIVTSICVGLTVIYVSNYVGVYI